ncbi:MAG: hypothetical protein J0M34_09320 [Alphaproteobacteria bacterium]|nr:hypothetical protein [Alphaproteobacteria bacterium]
MTQQTAHNLEASEQKRDVSKGEKAFDFTVYGLMNWVGTFVITVPIAYWMMHGKGSLVTSIRSGVNKGFESIMEPTLKAADWVLSPIRKAPKTPMKERVKWWSEQNTVTFATFQGGNFMLLPIWLAERGKVPLVDGANKALGDETDRAAIAEAPKTDIVSLIKGRLSAFALVFTTFTTLSHIVPQTFRSFSEEFGEKAAGWFKKSAYTNMDDAKQLLIQRNTLEKLGDVSEEGLKALKSANTKLEALETRAFRLGKIASWDIVATTAAVALLYTTSKFFAQEKDKKSHDKDVKRKAKQPAPDAVPTTRVGVERSVESPEQAMQLG